MHRVSKKKRFLGYNDIKQYRSPMIIKNNNNLDYKVMNKKIHD